MLRRFFKDESGMETVEYAVFGALLMVVALAGGRALWEAVDGKFSAIATWITGVA